MQFVKKSFSLTHFWCFWTDFFSTCRINPRSSEGILCPRRRSTIVCVKRNTVWKPRWAEGRLGDSWTRKNGNDDVRSWWSWCWKVRRAVQPTPVLWSGAGAPDIDCTVQCRCVLLPPPTEAPQPWGSARKEPGHGRSRSLRLPSRGWWALGTGFWILSQCLKKEKRTQIRF